MSGVVKCIDFFTVDLNLIDEIEGHNHRLNPDQEAYDKLRISMSQSGQRDPILVRKNGERYQLVYGHNRYRAAKELHWTGITCRVISCNDGEAATYALAENYNRSSINPVEIAIGLRRARDCGISPDELLRKLGKITPDGKIDKLWMDNHLALLDMTEEQRKSVVEGMLSKTQAFELARMSREKREKVLKKAEEIQKKENAKKAKKAKAKPKPKQKKDDQPEPTQAEVGKLSDRVIRQAKKSIGIEVADKFCGFNKLDELVERVDASEYWDDKVKQLLKSVIAFVRGQRQNMPL